MKLIKCKFCFPESDGYEFVIVSLENKQWHFEAQNNEVRPLRDHPNHGPVKVAGNVCT